MADGIATDPAVMQSLADRLRSTGDDLDAAGRTAPGVPQAGEVAALMGAVIAHLAESAGNAVVGLKMAADSVEQACKDYLATDSARRARSGRRADADRNADGGRPGEHPQRRRLARRDPGWWT